MTAAQRVCPSCAAEYTSDVLFCPRDGAPLAAHLPTSREDPYLGLTIGGDMELTRLVGLGAMGRVYRAHQASMERPVAVKILHREHVRNPTLVARFRREGRVASSLAHPNVVGVYSAGELPRTGTSGEPFLVMEFLDGLSLRSALAAAGGALSLPRTLSVLLQICDAMGEAHARAIVHRDLKPENVMLVACGADPDFVKVLDFGVARVGEAESSIATHAGAVLGTAAYSCPENARGDGVGPAGDVYAIATLLFECLSGRTPFVGKSAVEVLIQHAQAKPPDVRDVAPSLDIPGSVASLIARNLDKNPLRRCQSARDFGGALVEACQASGIDVTALVLRRTLLGAAPQAIPPGQTAISSSPRAPLRTLDAKGRRA